MRLVPFQEAVGYDLKEKIPALRGKITRIHDHTAGVTNGNSWSFQAVELCDPDKANVRCRVKIWNRDIIPTTWMGKIVIIECVEGERGPKGVTMEQDTYRWKDGQPIKKQIEVQCGDGAIFELASGGNQPQNHPAPARPQPASAPQSESRPRTADPAPARPTGNQEPPAPEPERVRTRPSDGSTMTEEQRCEQVVKAAKFAYRKVSGFRACLRAMDQLAKERADAGKPLSPEQFQGMTTSIFIAGDRALVWENLPMTEELLEKYWPKPKKPVTPEPAAQ